ncbi:PLP-dependent cysteine synthase family protein [Promicromonospora sukumoe]|uniref:PLP-dependent cysteine synthase family protein n=1 Tax=Promicromonospora sukumoe TaxID=88382 RepID=UPI0036467796
MTAYDSLLDAVGGTPLVRLRRITTGLTATVHVKLEYLNPGGSVKDRAARWMVLEAIRTGALAPGGTIVEGTSGNTGIGLAQAAAQLGHPIVVVVPDKIAVEKISTLRAYGARVVVTGSGFPREHPESVRSIAHRIVAETPGAWLADQFDNPDNPRAHRESTGPEIWSDTGGRVTHLVAGAGTGGTITGTGEHLKEVSDGRVRVIGADPLGSTYSGGDGSPFFVEATGHYRHPETLDDAWPRSFHPDVVDRFERVSDREAVHTLLRLARLEGILVGGSAGLILAAALRTARDLGPDDVVVALLPDSGRAYLSKYLDEGWLRRLGFVDEPIPDLPGLDADGPVMLDALRAAGVVVPDAAAPDTTVTVDAGAPAGEAARYLADAVGRGRLDPGAPVPVLLDRPRRDLAPAVSEVLGTTDLTALRAADPDVRVGDVAAPPLPMVGTGERVIDVLRHWPANAGHAVVLRDGRAVAVVPRGLLTHAGGAAPSA